MKIKSLQQFINEELNREPEYQVIISYDISKNERKFYNAIHDPLKEEHGFDRITESTYKFPNKFTKKGLASLVKSIRTLHKELGKNNTNSRIDLIIAVENKLIVFNAIPGKK
jgi:uncharacterized protein (DUF608 family)